jgi:hypothetical protein
MKRQKILPGRLDVRDDSLLRIQKPPQFMAFHEGEILHRSHDGFHFGERPDVLFQITPFAHEVPTL